jgi:hypothetical protein
MSDTALATRAETVRDFVRQYAPDAAESWRVAIGALVVAALLEIADAVRELKPQPVDVALLNKRGKRLEPVRCQSKWTDPQGVTYGCVYEYGHNCRHYSQDHGAEALWRDEHADKT